jgi:hypothetical protein
MFDAVLFMIVVGTVLIALGCDIAVVVAWIWR